MRILITGISSYLGGRAAQALEKDPEVRTIIGIDTTEPRHEFDRTEFIKVGADNAAILRRILNAAAVDTVLDTRLVDDPLKTALRRAHEVNVAGTAHLLAACDDPNSHVTRLVFKSSAHYYGHDGANPAFLSEEAPPARARTAIERDVALAEAAVREFAARRGDRAVAILRVTDEIGGDGRGSHLALLALPIVPSILGFDPRLQFVHADDVVGAFVHVTSSRLEGVYNVAGDGVLALSEVVSLLGKQMLPILPPWGSAFAAAQLRRVGLRVPVEMVRQLRFGRGLDNRRLKAAGYHYRYTSREAVLKLRAQQRLRPLLGAGAQPYRYEREVEEFLRWSPSVQARNSDPSHAPEVEAPGTAGETLTGFDALPLTELIDLISSLDPEALSMLRAYESAHRARPRVLEALDRTLYRKRSEK